jgi:peptidoglycan/xylan/chitin deacetylase (PgdA/CDA1 family)
MAQIAGSDQRLIDLYAWAADPASPDDDGIALTFDDGYRDFLDGALPLLMERRWPAVVFVVADAAGGRIRFPWYPSSHPALLTWDDMRAIERQSRVRFEPHTLTHPVLVKVTEDEAWREISGSKAAVEDALGREARLFCYPGGHFGPREAALVERAGFRAAVGCEYGVNGPPWDRFALRRTAVDRYDGSRIFAARLRGAADVAPIGRRLRGGTLAR